METKDVLSELRAQHGLSQSELAERVHVTRQAVSRWETGETVPSSDTLKLLSQVFDVSINTLLGSPRRLICQCCGMPLDDASISREPDGAFNEDYCKWCYADGRFVYADLKELTDFLVGHMANENWPEAQVRAFLEKQLSQLDHWNKKAIPSGIAFPLRITQTDRRNVPGRGKGVERATALSQESRGQRPLAPLISGGSS